MESKNLIADIKKSLESSYNVTFLNNFFSLAHGMLQSGSANLCNIAVSAIKYKYYNEEHIDKSDDISFTKEIRNIKDRITRSSKKKYVRKFSKEVLRIFIGLISFNCPISLIMDRTNWTKRNGEKINLLVIGVAFSNDIFIPLGYELLDKKQGNSNTDERIDLVEEFLDAWGPVAYGSVFIGDREFVGSDWIEALEKKGFQIVVRIRKNMYITAVAKALGIREDEVELVISKEKNAKGIFKTKIIINGKEYTYIVFKYMNRENLEEDLILLTDLDNPDEAVEKYKERWAIETAFKCLKSNGYYIEEVNVKGKSAVIFFFLAALVNYIVSILNGLAKANTEKIREIKYRDKNKNIKSKSPEKSLFKFGNDNFKIKAAKMQNYLIKIMEFMLGPPIDLEKFCKDRWYCLF